ncbi:MAG: hypothetical protein CV087_09685 [Candidatus Brocadia sp. WS118]|nr:MAG: hypothetical protein CV087_09685 [Candidatus Brocadia sp. WS118]
MTIIEMTIYKKTIVGYGLLLTVVFLLACGAPAYIAPTDVSTPTQQIANTAAPTPQTTRTITGCWNIRETPAGKVIDAVCNDDLKVYGLVDGWMKIDGGYICPRAFGDAAECEVQ